MRYQVVQTTRRSFRDAEEVAGAWGETAREAVAAGRARGVIGPVLQAHARAKPRPGEYWIIDVRPAGAVARKRR